MKKVLIIAFYWPPSGGGGVVRCLNFAKYFRDFGWEPVVYTAKDPEYPVLDHSLEAKVPKDITVIKHPIWEPYAIYKRFIGQKKDERVVSGFLSEDKKPSLTKRISVWIRGNFFIPDARKFWIKPSIKFLKQYLKENPVDAIISSGPPHSMHMIARGLKKAYPNIPWVADFRDPWTNIDFYQHLMLTKWADKKHHKFEKAVLNEADDVVTVSWHWADDFRKLGAPDIKVVTNGFDTADFEYGEVPMDEKFTFTHIGLLNTDRNAPKLWEAMAELCEEHADLKRDLKVQLVGKTDISVFQTAERLGISDNVEKIDYMPHDQVVKLLAASQVTLLLVNDTPNSLGVVPGKIFEYLAVNRPIFSVGPTKGDSARIIREANAGNTLEFADKEGMKKEIMRLYRLYQEGNLNVKAEDILKYSRRETTRDMAEILDRISK